MFRCNVDENTRREDGVERLVAKRKRHARSTRDRSTRHEISCRPRCGDLQVHAGQRFVAHPREALQLLTGVASHLEETRLPRKAADETAIHLDLGEAVVVQVIAVPLLGRTRIALRVLLAEAALPDGALMRHQKTWSPA